MLDDISMTDTIYSLYKKRPAVTSTAGLIFLPLGAGMEGKMDGTRNRVPLNKDAADAANPPPAYRPVPRPCKGRIYARGFAPLLYVGARA